MLGSSRRVDEYAGASTRPLIALPESSLSPEALEAPNVSQKKDSRQAGKWTSVKLLVGGDEARDRGRDGTHDRGARGAARRRGGGGGHGGASGDGVVGARARRGRGGEAAPGRAGGGKGLHSSTLQLNVRTFCVLHASTFWLDVSTFRGLC